MLKKWLEPNFFNKIHRIQALSKLDPPSSIIG